MRKLSVRLPDELAERLRARAQENGRSVQRELQLYIERLVSGEVDRALLLVSMGQAVGGRP